MEHHRSRSDDALLGEQTREHRDLDLMHRAEQERTVSGALRAAGFAERLDQRSVRFVFGTPNDRELDLHPLEFAPGGSALQSFFTPGSPFRYPADAFASGTVAGAAVPCLSAAQQVYFHQGYEPAAHDLRDMARLRRRFGIATHF